MLSHGQTNGILSDLDLLEDGDQLIRRAQILKKNFLGRWKLKKVAPLPTTVNEYDALLNEFYDNLVQLHKEIMTVLRQHHNWSHVAFYIGTTVTGILISIDGILYGAESTTNVNVRVPPQFANQSDPFFNFSTNDLSINSTALARYGLSVKILTVTIPAALSAIILVVRQFGQTPQQLIDTFNNGADEYRHLRENKNRFFPVGVIETNTQEVLPAPVTIPTLSRT